MGSHEDFLAISSLSELYESDPVGEYGCEKSSDKVSIHNEEPTRWDVKLALQLSNQNLRGNLNKVETELSGFRMFLTVKITVRDGGSHKLLEHCLHC